MANNAVMAPEAVRRALPKGPTKYLSEPTGPRENGHVAELHNSRDCQSGKAVSGFAVKFLSLGRLRLTLIKIAKVMEVISSCLLRLMAQ